MIEEKALKRALKPGRFIGWYFRHAGEYPFSFIAGASTAEGDPHAFVQYIDAFNSEYCRFPLSDFRVEADTLCVGKNRFSKKGIYADLSPEGKHIAASVVYSDGLYFKGGVWSPTVMGPFSYFPLPCRHSAVALRHKCRGTLLPPGGGILEIGADGYIEGDSGRRFPKNYVWLHALGREASVMFAYAKPAAFGLGGFLCLAERGGKQYNLSLYNGARITLVNNERGVSVSVRRGHDRVELNAQNSLGAQRLVAPDPKGRMTVEVQENLTAPFSGSMVLGGERVDLSDIGVCAFERSGGTEH